LFDANNTCIWVVAIIFTLALQVACVNKSKENVILAFFSFEHCDGQMGGVGRTDDHASRYGWVVW
jgi:hypothetical protein